MGRSLTPGVRRNRTINLNYDQKRIKTTKKCKTTTQQPEKILQSNKLQKKNCLIPTQAWDSRCACRGDRRGTRAARRRSPRCLGCRGDSRRPRPSPVRRVCTCPSCPRCPCRRPSPVVLARNSPRKRSSRWRA